MKRYLLDTPLVAGFLHGRPKAVGLIKGITENCVKLYAKRIA
jgi:hypothetical protein